MGTVSPDISIIIPAFNAAHTLNTCIRALDTQRFPTKAFEIIVVNDRSTDATGTILSCLKRDLSANLRVVQHSVNRGRSAARNSGIKAASGRLLIFLDADLEVPPDFIARHVEHYRSAGVVGVSGTSLPAPGIPDTKYQRYLYQAKRGGRKHPPDQPLHYSAFLFNNCSLRKKVFTRVGLFDEKICHYGGEDTEMAYRIWQQYPAGLSYDPQLTVRHHHYRKLPHVLHIIENFGACVVPYLVQKHPTLAGLYRYDWLKYRFGLTTPAISIIKLVSGRIIRAHISQRMLFLLYHLMPYPISNYVIKALMASALLRGIASAKNTPDLA